jgi:TRAP-type mannitol/chloroaromatic compound transport system permease small subunit
MKLRAKYITRITIKVIAMIVFLSVLSIIWTSIAPVVTNEMAMGQMENDHTGFIAWEIYQKIDNFVPLIMVLLALPFLYSTGKDVGSLINIINN